MNKLFLLDAFALIFRAHFAFTKNPRINSKGVNTSVPFGFINTMLEVIQKQKPTHIGVAFDTSAPTFRDELFSEYKANRQETPEDVKAGTPIVKDIIRAFNIPVLELDGFEADDIIGTLALQAQKQGMEVFMMSSDKDYGQLVRENVWLYKPAHLGNAVEVMGEAEVCARWDIAKVDQVIDILGLQGDASDNIPGIPGVGPKTAAELLKTYSSVENIIAHAHELKGKLKERVEQNAEQALLSKRLATINIEVPIPFEEEKLRYKGPDETALKALFETLEFRTLSTRIFAKTASAASKASSPTQTEGKQISMFDGNAVEQQNYKTVTDEEEVKKIAESLANATEFGLEVVTNEAPNFDFETKAIAIALSSGEVYYFPKENLQHLKAVLNGEAIKVGHQLKASVLALRKEGIDCNGQLFDTQVAHYLIEPEASHDLSVIANQYLGVQLIESNDQIKRACERADMAMKAKKHLQKELENRGQTNLMTTVEMPLMKVLAEMEFEGVTIDTDKLKEMSNELKKDSQRLQAEIFEIAGVEFNIASPKQLGEVLFDNMRLLDKAKKTKTGQYATGEDILAKLATEHEIAKKILDFRENEKLRSTYVDALPRMISRFDGRVHTDYRQAVAATGRLSSNNPNLQNIPIRTGKGKKIREAFVARDKEHLILSADYSQIELRLAAAFAKDATMLEAFKNGRDIHTTTASKVFKVDINEVTPDMRRKAKEVNFGILYGSTAFGLSQNIRISKTEATEIIDSYFKEFFSIKKYMDDSINFAREHEYVETLLGRRRYLRDINSKNQTTRGFAERNAINAPIQGSAADIIKLAMLNIQQWMKQEKLKSKMIMQVHDELVFDAHKQEVDILKEQVPLLMKTAVQLEVTLDAEVAAAENWLGAHG